VIEFVGHQQEDQLYNTLRQLQYSFHYIHGAGEGWGGNEVLDGVNLRGSVVIEDV